jgi:nucleoside-triphosphatase
MGISDPNAEDACVRRQGRVLLLTGRPGSGKTTVLKAVAARFPPESLGGFYTEEIRVSGERQGFRLVTFDGREDLMAHIHLRGTPRVGRYGVDVAVVDKVASAALQASEDVDLYLVDEIGKMECLSRRFSEAMCALFKSTKTIVATVALRGGSFIAEVKARRDALLWEVTRQNRDELPDRIVAWLGKRNPA